MPEKSAAARALLTASAVRARARKMLELCEAGQLPHWRFDTARLPVIAGYVLATIKQNYPSLDIPFHARWRHFETGGVDRWSRLRAIANWPDTQAMARAAFDLTIVSVLLDAGAGTAWRYRDTDGAILSRSEGLGVASLNMFAAGAFSAHAGDPFRCDASRLQTISAGYIGRAFQVSADNPLAGLEGRASLLRALGDACLANPARFASHGRPRPGGLFDALAEFSGPQKTLPAERILITLLESLGPIWPSRITLHGVALGDCWRHPALVTGDETTGLIPFHKLSQWMSYSLIEPLQWGGLAVSDIEGLTGLPEYRNGGLFVDLGALVLRDPAAARRAHEPGSELIVEWRALTVALLDKVAGLVRTKLNRTAADLPLAKILEGGTWAAGRRIAREKREDGSPPLSIISDGTVF